MDIDSYVQRTESAVEDPERLHQIQADALADPDLAVAERDEIVARAGTYLADLRRGQDIDHETDPEEETE